MSMAGAAAFQMPSTLRGRRSRRRRVRREGWRGRQLVIERATGSEYRFPCLSAVNPRIKTRGRQRGNLTAGGKSHDADTLRIHMPLFGAAADQADGALRIDHSIVH